MSAFRTQFNTIRAQSQSAQATTDRQRDEPTAVYTEAQSLAVDICDTVEFFYRKEADAASRRAKCQRWGVVYIYEGAAPTPPEPTPPTPPAPTAP